MQIIINITEHNKSVIDRYIDGHGYSYKDLTRTTVIESLAQAVHKGIVLPKEHGRLIDADVLEKRIYELTGNGDMIFIDAIIDDAIGNAEPIIPASGV